MIWTNGLSRAEEERLAILLEELGEAQQAIGKILRHGYASYDPTLPEGENGPSNRLALERELGDVSYAIALMVNNRDLSQGHIHQRTLDKAVKIAPYLHFNAPGSTSGGVDTGVEKKS